MLKRSAMLISVVLGIILASPHAFGQQGNAAELPTFVLIGAANESPDDDPEQRNIDVKFDPSTFPADESILKNVNNWVVVVVDQFKVEKLNPETVAVFSSKKIVVLRMASTFDRQSFDTSTHKTVIFFKQGKLPPSVTLSGVTGTAKIKKTFMAAKGKADADIYFSGNLAAARNSKPSYSIESKFGYLRNIVRRVSNPNNPGQERLKDYGSIGGKATFESSDNSSIDPDSITATATYRKLFVLNDKLEAFVINADFIGGEFAKRNRTLNLVSKFDVGYAPRDWHISKRQIASIDFLAGIEVGHNYKNVLAPDGIGNFLRWKAGANTYYIVQQPFGLLDHFAFNIEYKLRLPQSAEIFSRVIDGTRTPFLTKKPRHYVASDLDFSFNKFFGFAVQYRYGSLPPSFNLVDSKIGLGIKLQLKQNPQ